VQAVETIIKRPTSKRVSRSSDALGNRHTGDAVTLPFAERRPRRHAQQRARFVRRQLPVLRHGEEGAHDDAGHGRCRSNLLRVSMVGGQGS